MDFLEGYLLGPQWSDTEYETRHHAGFHLLVGLAVAIAFGFLLQNPDHAARWIWPWPIPVLLLAILLFLNPLLCRHYYRHSHFIRFLILLLIILKFIMAILTLYAVTLPLVRLDTSQLATTLLSQVNESIAAMTDRLHALNNASAMIFGIVLGSLLVLLRTLLAVAICVLVPTLFILAVRWTQRILDWVIRRQLKLKPDME